MNVMQRNFVLSGWSLQYQEEMLQNVHVILFYVFMRHEPGSESLTQHLLLLRQLPLTLFIQIPHSICYSADSCYLPVHSV